MDHSHFSTALPSASATVPFSEAFATNVTHAAPPVPPTSAPQNLNPMSPLSFDLEDMTTTDLLNNINPELLDYVKCNTPHVYSGLLAQERINTTPTTDSLLPVHTQLPPNVNVNSPTPQLAAALASQMRSPPVPHPLGLALPTSMPTLAAMPPVASLSITPLATNPTNSPHPSLLPAVHPAARRAAPAPMPVSSPLSDPSLSVSNPALLSVLRQAQAMASISHLQPQSALTHRNFSAAGALSMAPNSPLHAPNNAAVAAVAGAAAAAAAAAANCTPPQAIHQRFAPASLQNKRLVERSYAANASHAASARSRVARAQAARVLKSSHAPSQVHAMTSTPVQLQSPQTPPSTMLGQKRPNSAIKQAAAAAASTVLSTSSSGKRSATLPSTTSQCLSNTSAPANRSRLHAAVGSFAGVGASVGSRASSASTGDGARMALKVEHTEEVVPRSAAGSIQASDAEEDADLEVKKAMRAERNRQSAAASRERKKQYIKELERRVDMLSEENAKMQVSQFRMVRERLDLESKILDEVKQLKRKVVVRDMEIHKLSRELQNAKLKVGDDEDEEECEVPRPSTWDAAEWRKKKTRSSRRRV